MIELRISLSVGFAYDIAIVGSVFGLEGKFWGTGLKVLVEGTVLEVVILGERSEILGWGMGF